MDPRTKDYVIENGVTVNDPTVLTPAYFRSIIPRAQWMYAPNADYGSDFARNKKKNVPGVERVLVATQERCLQPLIDDGRAVTVDTRVAGIGRNGVVLETLIVDTQGTPNVLILPGIGV